MKLITSRNILIQGVIIILISTFIGCSSSSHHRIDHKSYSFGKTKTCTNGDLIAEDVYGEVKSKKKWVGVMFSEDGWGPTKITFSDDYIEKKLYYLGRKDSHLHLLYKEFVRGNKTPTVNKDIMHNLNESSFIAIGDFNLEVEFIDGTGTEARFLILDKAAFNDRKRQFKIAQDTREKEETFSKVIYLIKSEIKKAQDAKEYADQFGEVLTLNSYSQTVSAFKDLKTSFEQASKTSNYSKDELAQIYETLETQLPNYTQFFTSVATALQSWDAMIVAMQNAEQSGIKNDYLASALDAKKSGEQDLKEGLFEQATQKFTQAKNAFNAAN